MGLFIISTVLLVMMVAEKLFFLGTESLTAQNLPMIAPLVILVALSLAGIVSFLFKKNVKEGKDGVERLSIVGALALIATIFILSISLYLNYHKTAVGWDAVALYDARAKYLGEGVKFSEMNALSKYDIQNGYYYSLYPPFTSIAHFLWHGLFGSLPIGLFYWAYYLVFGLIVFLATKKDLGLNLSIFLVFITLCNHTIFESSLVEYTNLPFSLYLLLGVFLLMSFLKTQEKWKLIFGIGLVISSQWIRFLEPLWIAVIVAFAVACYSDKRLTRSFSLLGYFLLFGLIEYFSWNNFVNEIAKSPQIITLDFLKITEPLLGIFTGSMLKILLFFVKSWGIILLVYVGALLVDFKKSKKAPHILFLKAFIIFTVLIYFVGLYFVSFQSTWWDRLGDSLVRGSTFLIPISGYVFLNTLSKLKRSKYITSNSGYISVKQAIISLKYLFYLVWGVAFSMSTIEAVFYPGVFKANLHIAVYPIYAAAFFLLVIFKALNPGERYTRSDIAFGYGKRMALFSGAGFLIFSFFELISYPNFVFSNFHLHPNALIWPFALSAALYIFGYQVQNLLNLEVWKVKGKIVLRKIKSLDLFACLICLVVLAIFFINLSKNIQNFRDNLIYILRNPRISTEQKLRKKVTPIFYDYVVFINKNTPEDAKILIPPQGFPWPQSGNYAYIRYFIFPRAGTSGKEYEPGINIQEKGISYVLLAWGETETTEYGYTHGWPKFDIPADWITYYDEKGNTYKKDGNYYYKEFAGKKVWGVIKVKGH